MFRSATLHEMQYNCLGWEGDSTRGDPTCTLPHHRLQRFEMSRMSESLASECRFVWFRAQDNPSMRSQKFDYRRKTLIRSLYKLQPSARHAQPPANGSCGRRKPPVHCLMPIALTQRKGVGPNRCMVDRSVPFQPQK